MPGAHPNIDLKKWYLILFVDIFNKLFLLKNEMHSKLEHIMKLYKNII